MKAHRPWQPRLDRDPLFNPFVPTTVRPFVEEGIDLASAEEEQVEEPTVELMPDQPAAEPPAIEDK